MTVDFGHVKFDQEVLAEATKEAAKNWLWWEEDFDQDNPFHEMPVLQSYPRFRGFGADYSVFRGMTADEADQLRICLLDLPDPTSFRDLFSAAKPNLGGKMRISLISKLLAMWRPQKFAMWDTLARAGLKSLHNSTRKHCYNANTLSDYETFCSDFFHLHTLTKEQLSPHADGAGLNADPTKFSARILDNILMAKGK